MANENDIITHFSMQGSPPLFLCLLWKMLLETDHINQIGFRFGVINLCVYRFTYRIHTELYFFLYTITAIVYTYSAVKKSLLFNGLCLNTSESN